MNKKIVALIIALVVVLGTAAASAVAIPAMRNQGVELANYGWIKKATVSTDETGVTTDSANYKNNTVSVLGLSLRDLELSDKWYNVVPVDLTQPSTVTIPLVAANMYYFAYATVEVGEETVTVTYELPEGNVTLEGECLQWFNSFEEITDEFLENPQGAYAFGEPVSLEDDLRGQNVALLFICNRVSYTQPLTNKGEMLIRYYASNPEWVAWREEINAVLDTMVVVTEEEYEAKKAAEAEAAAAAAEAEALAAAETAQDVIEDLETALEEAVEEVETLIDEIVDALDEALSTDAE